MTVSSYCHNCIGPGPLVLSDFDGREHWLCGKCLTPPKVSRYGRISPRRWTPEIILGHIQRELPMTLIELAKEIKINPKTLRWHLIRMRNAGSVRWGRGTTIEATR